MLLGVVVLAAGVKAAIGHVTDPLTIAPALAGGVALFLLGDAAFRRTLRIGRHRYRALAGIVALATAPAGLVASGIGAGRARDPAGRSARRSTGPSG